MIYRFRFDQLHHWGELERSEFVGKKRTQFIGSLFTIRAMVSENIYNDYYVIERRRHENRSYSYIYWNYGSVQQF